MQHRFPLLASSFFNTPLAITPHKAEIIMAALGDRFGITHLLRPGMPAPAALADFGSDEPAAQWTPYAVQGGVAIIPVEGTLVPKLGSMQPWSGMTGYDGIRANLAQALADPDVRAIILDIDSPGGSVQGCFDLVDSIYFARGVKPLWAVLDESAYSAAYAIASACDRVLIPRTGGAGSIGVITMHCDLSRALDNAGMLVTILSYGDRKADGTETMPLPDDVKARFQADIDVMGDLFVETVARNRQLPPSVVRDTQAGTYMGAAAVVAGLADAVASPQAALAALQTVL